MSKIEKKVVILDSPSEAKKGYRYKYTLVTHRELKEELAPIKKALRKLGH